MKLQLTPEGKKAVVAFGKLAKPLGEMTAKEQKEVAMIAVESGSKSLASYFVELPSERQVKNIRAKQVIGEDNTEETVGADGSDTPEGENNNEPVDNKNDGK